MRRSRSSRSIPTSSAGTSGSDPGFHMGRTGLIQICGKNAVNLDAVIAACKAIAGHPGVLRFQDFVINTDVIVLSTPEIAGPSVCDLGPGRGRRPCGRAVHRRRPPARHRQRAQPRRLLQDARPERADHPSAHRGARAVVLRRGGVAALAATSRRTSWPWWAGRSQRDGGQLPSHRARHLVETRDHHGRDLRHHRRVGHMPVLPRGLAVFPAGWRDLFRHASLLNPETGQAWSTSLRSWPIRNGCRRSGERGQPLANRVGWFDLNNINCGLLGCRSASW